MMDIEIQEDLIVPLGELTFRTSRSRGPGGQNVNKLETRVELEFDVGHSPSLSEDQRKAILGNLSSRIDARGILRIVSQESRSQWTNKKLALERFVELLQKALKPKKKRKPTLPTSRGREERLRTKKRRGVKKLMRRAPGEEP